MYFGQNGNVHFKLNLFRIWDLLLVQIQGDLLNVRSIGGSFDFQNFRTVIHIHLVNFSGPSDGLCSVKAILNVQLLNFLKQIVTKLTIPRLVWHWSAWRWKTKLCEEKYKLLHSNKVFNNIGSTAPLPAKIVDWSLNWNFD